MSPFTAFRTLIVLAVLATALSCVFIVKETEKALVKRFGELLTVDIEPGLHFKGPFFVDEVVYFDGRILTEDARPESFFTVQQKRLLVDSFVKWRIADVGTYYRSTGGDERVAGNRLAARVNDGLRNEFGARTLHEVVSGERDALMLNLTKTLTDQVLKALGIEVIDVRVKRIDLPPAVSDSVYERMRTEREREARELRARGKELAEGIRADADRQKTVVEAEAYRESELIRGEGDATAANIYANAYQQNPEFYSFHRSLQAYRKSFTGGGDMMVLKPDSDFFKYLSEPKAPAAAQ